ncbi:RidA family protein [Tianweitania sp.]|uniref:RidA family protein n=1 Tax=Tianweitania sp. TaxID=2021634 RepID=UPI00289D630F|nr:RidA family protein [Tianweitania sp.]
MGLVSSRMAELGLSLPEITSPSGTYVPFRMSGQTLYISGQVPRIDGVDAYLGVVGQDMDVAEAYQAARVCALNLLARAASALDGDLDRISAVLQLRGFVNAIPAFKDHPAVIDGASDLLVEVLGEKGRHARTALGAGSLPRGFAVEVDAIFEVQP